MIIKCSSNGWQIKLEGLPEPLLISCFLLGLRDDIRVTVQIWRPKTLMYAPELARFQEEVIIVTSEASSGTRSSDLILYIPDNPKKPILNPPENHKKPILNLPESNQKKLINSTSKG